MAKLKVGIIGTGYRAVKAFGPLLIAEPGVEITALCDINPVRMRRAADYLNLQVGLYGDFEEFIAKADCSAVIISSPDRFHGQQTMGCLQSDRHVLCEKPLALSVLDATRCMELAQERSLVYLPGHVLRYTALYQQVRNIIDNGDIGRPVMVYAQDLYGKGKSYFRRWNRYTAQSGGLLLHKGCHTFDLVPWWTGARPERAIISGGLAVFNSNDHQRQLCRDCLINCPDYYDIGESEIDRAIFGPETEQPDSEWPKDICIFGSPKDTFDHAGLLCEYNTGLRLIYAQCFFSPENNRLIRISGDEGELNTSQEFGGHISVTDRHNQNRYEAALNMAEEGHWGGDRLMVQDFIRRATEGRPMAEQEILPAIYAIATALGVEPLCARGA